MGAVSTVLRILSDFGEAAGWLIAAVVLFVYGRRIVHDNDRAHAAITENVQQVEKKIDVVETKLEKKIDAVETKLEKKIGAVETKLEKKIDALDRKIDAVETKLEKKIDAVETKLERKIDTVETKIDALAKDVAFIAGRLTEKEGP